MRESVIVLSRASDGDVNRRAFEDAIARGLDETGRTTALVTPSVYHMTDSDAGLAAIRSLTEDVLLASWLHPRAAYWLLRARGIDGDPRGCCDSGYSGSCCSEDTANESARVIRACNLAALDSPERWVREMVDRAEISGRGSCREIAGAPVPRWYPVVDHLLCARCGQCHDFCLFGVYSLDHEDRPLVSAGDRCKPGCAACARICPEGAIMFPLYTADDGIAGAPGKRPATAPVNVEAFFARAKEPCPVCGCSCDCERATDGIAPPGKTICPACGCICDPSCLCTCKPQPASGGDKRGKTRSAPRASPASPRDDLDGLIDALDELDV